MGGGGNVGTKKVLGDRPLVESWPNTPNLVRILEEALFVDRKQSADRPQRLREKDLLYNIPSLTSARSTPMRSRSVSAVDVDRADPPLVFSHLDSETAEMEI